MNVYNAFKINETFADIFDLFEVYDFMPDELEDFLIGQVQVNNSGNATQN
jgi:hypothetical protein